MAEQTAQPGKRWVVLTFFEHAVERTEEQIRELKAGRLWIRDASGPGDRQQEGAPQKADDAPGPVLIPESAPQPAAKAAEKPAA